MSSGSFHGPSQARLITFFDGQNLFGAAKRAYGYARATYDPLLLSKHVAESLACQLKEVRFYTGIHKHTENPTLYSFWQSKLKRMANAGVRVFSRDLEYHTEEIELPDGTKRKFRVPREKGIDIRIALDMVRLVRAQELETIVVFSQDNDLIEACNEVKEISQEQRRFVRIRSAYPIPDDPAKAKRERGIDQTEWHRIQRSAYDACCDAAVTHSSKADISHFGAALQAALANSQGRKQ